MKNILLISLISLMFAACVPESETTFNEFKLPPSSSIDQDGGDNGDGNKDGPDRPTIPIVQNPKQPKPEDVVKAVNDCNIAGQKNQLISYKTTVFFPAAIECSFNEGAISLAQVNALGNGPRIDGRVTARVEQQYSVQLPTAGKICDIDFEFPNQAMEYDDEIFLLLNNYVLMSSTNYSTLSGSRFYATNGLKVNNVGLQEYNWLGGVNALYGLKYGQAITPRYCLGLDQASPDYATKCQIPATEQMGQIRLEIPSIDLVKLGVSSVANQNTANLDFGFVSTGDNDNGDCEHSAFSFDITVQYIQ